MRSYQVHAYLTKSQDNFHSEYARTNNRYC